VECSWEDPKKRRFDLIDMKVDWLRGCILTSDQLEAFLRGNPAPGHIRNKGYEWAALRVRREEPIESLQITVQIASGFVPPEGVMSLYSEGDEADSKLGVAWLSRYVHTIDEGLYQIEIPFPERGCTYGIAWKPAPPPQPSEAALSFQSTAENNGDFLVQLFLDCLDDALRNVVTVSLYIPEKPEEPHLEPLKRVGYRSSVSSVPERPRQEEFILHDDILGDAWWGASTRTDTDEHHVLKGEKAVISFPVRFETGWVGEPSWGVLRLGVHGDEDRVREIVGQSLDLKQSLDRAMLHMIQKTM